MADRASLEDPFALPDDGALPEGWTLFRGVPTPPEFQEVVPPLPVWRWILYVIFLPLTLLRLVLFLILLVVMFVVTIPFGLCCPPSPAKGLSRWSPMAILGVLVVRLQLLIAGYWWIRVEKKGVQSPAEVGLDAPPTILVCNHVAGFFDAMLLFLRFRMRVVARAGVKNSIFGPPVRALGSIFVHRFSKDSPRGAQTQVIIDAAKAKGAPILIFPEGFTSNGVSINSFRKGAFAAGEPVRMTVVKYPGRWVSPAWIRPNHLQHYFQALASFWTGSTVVDCGIYVPNEEEKADAGLFAKNVQARMAELSGLGVADWTFKQKKLWMSKVGYQLND